MFQHDATGAGLLAGFLASLNHKGQSLMCSDELATIPALHQAAQRADELLEGQDEEVRRICRGITVEHSRWGCKQVMVYQCQVQSVQCCCDCRCHGSWWLVS